MKRKYCDTILYNGKVVTVDKDFSIAEAVAIGDSKFVKVGENAEVRALAAQNTQEIDLQGKTVVPGFIDTHPHMIHAGMGRASGAVPLMGLRSIEAIKKRIAERVEKTPPGEWVVTMPVGDMPDYFHLPDILQEKRWPTRWDLDEVSPNNPVYVASPITVFQPAILNSYGLKIMEVTRDTPSEEKGVQIVKDPQTGEPNGQLHGMHLWSYGSFYWKLMAMLPQPTFEQLINGVKARTKDFNVAGVTTGYEGHVVGPRELLLCKELWSRNELTMRIYFAYEVDVRKSMAEIESWMKDLAHATGSGFGDDRLKIGGITVSIDGPRVFGVSVTHRPYLDPYGRQATGVQQVPTDKLKEITLLAAKNNLRMNIQVAGDKANDIALEAIEEVNRRIPIKDRRWVIQHIPLPRQDNINKCKELGVAITTVSNFEFARGPETSPKRLGVDYLAMFVPFRRWLDAGVLTAQSTDGEHYQPMFTIWQSLKRISGRTGEEFMNANKEITREEALRLYTINGARVLFWEDKLGSIEASKLADLVVLDNDILTCPLDDIKDTRVLMTMLGGEVVYEES